LFKPQQVKANKRACICLLLFFRIGAFQGVATDSNSFFLSLRSVVPICAVVLAALAADAVHGFHSIENYTCDSDFQQGKLSKKLEAPDRVRSFDAARN
jgi:hypothetical protein